MDNVYIEQNCTFSFQGQDFEAGGAVVTDDICYCYPGKADSRAPINSGDKGRLFCGDRGPAHDWQGNVIGRYQVTAEWQTPRSWISSSYYQMTVTLDDGRRYTGRSAGANMLFKGRRTAASRKEAK